MEPDDDFLSDFDDDGTEKSDSGGFLDEFDESGKLKESKPDTITSDKVQYRPEVYYHTSERMTELGDESVHLVVTSPPYNTDWSYGSHDDDLNYSDEYMPMLARIFNECYRVLVPGGRMIVNVPSLLRDGASGGFPIASDITTMLRSTNSTFMFRYPDEHESIAKLRTQTDWRTREWVVWNKGFNTDGLAPNGSFPRPWGVLLNNMHEVAVVFQKPGQRKYDDMPEEIIEESKIQKWADDLCDDVWDISATNWSPQYVDGENVPPFPEEFVKRCIALWTYVGDTVLDPFAGRFTTGKVAKKMKRYSVGYEIREQMREDIEEYVEQNQSGLSSW